MLMAAHGTRPLPPIAVGLGAKPRPTRCGSGRPSARLRDFPQTPPRPVIGRPGRFAGRWRLTGRSPEWRHMGPPSTRPEVPAPEGCRGLRAWRRLPPHHEGPRRQGTDTRTASGIGRRTVRRPSGWSGSPVAPLRPRDPPFFEVPPPHSPNLRRRPPGLLAQPPVPAYSPRRIGPWCNGSTSGFGPDGPSSNLGGPVSLA